MPTSAGPHAAEEGIGSATIIQNSGVSTYSSPTGNGSAHSFSSDGWDGGGHYRFDWSSPTPVSAVGTVFQFDQASSDRAPDNIRVAVSYNGGPYQTLLTGPATSDTPPNPAWNATIRDLRYTYDLPRVNNPPLLTSLSYQIVLSDSGSIGGGPVLPSANVRIDNVSIEYDDPTVPEPSAFALTAICIAAIPAVRRAR